jgi:hypothetical protein
MPKASKVAALIKKARPKKSASTRKAAAKAAPSPAPAP